MSAITMGMSSTGTTRRSSAPGALHGTGEIPNKKAEFATFDQDPRQWHDFLKSRGADEGAMAQLFALAQTSWGYDEAMKIMHKMLKKESGGQNYSVRNVSAFICSSVKGAWNYSGS